MKLTFTTVCGKTTCAESPGKFCHFAGSKSFGQKGWCMWYDCRLWDKDGWLQRCEECMKENRP